MLQEAEFVHHDFKYLHAQHRCYSFDKGTLWSFISDPLQPPQNIYWHCFCKLPIFEHLPIYSHCTKLPREPILCASKHSASVLRDTNSAQILLEGNWMHFADGHLFTRMVFPGVRLELAKWACLIAPYFKSKRNF